MHSSSSAVYVLQNGSDFTFAVVPMDELLTDETQVLRFDHVPDDLVHALEVSDDLGALWAEFSAHPHLVVDRRGFSFWTGNGVSSASVDDAGEPVLPSWGPLRVDGSQLLRWDGCRPYRHRGTDMDLEHVEVVVDVYGRVRSDTWCSWLRRASDQRLICLRRPPSKASSRAWAKLVEETWLEERRRAVADMVADARDARRTSQAFRRDGKQWEARLRRLEHAYAQQPADVPAALRLAEEWQGTLAAFKTTLRGVLAAAS